MATLWSCPNSDCPPTEIAPADRPTLSPNVASERPALAAHVRRNLADYPVEVVEARLEEWDCEPARMPPWSPQSLGTGSTPRSATSPPPVPCDRRGT
jgi:hypothetical protein